MRKIKLELTHNGEIGTGFGVMKRFSTNGERPRITSHDHGLVFTDAYTDDIKGEWVWIIGPDWEGMLFSNGDGLHFTTIMGGIQSTQK
jgi:hypothetical protein